MARLSLLFSFALLLAPSPSLRVAALDASVLDALLLSNDFPYPVSGFLLGDASGTLYARALGGYNMSGGVSVASASKWVAQMVISLLLTDGTLSLNDTTGSLLAAPWGGLPSSDPRRNISLRSLLSFTSGMNDTELTAPCASQGAPAGITPSSCAEQLWSVNAPLPYPPSPACPSTYFYAGSHQLLAGYMAVAAAGALGWNALFAARIARPLGLSLLTFFTPLSNPHPAGGLYISAVDYAKVLQAYFSGTLLPPSAVAVIEADYTPEPGTCIAYAPLAPALHWHYGLGHWLECRVGGSYGAQGSWQPACDALCHHSSIGKFGTYPFIDRCTGFWAVLMVANGSAVVSAALGEWLWPAVRAALAATASISLSASPAASMSAAALSATGVSASASEGVSSSATAGVSTSATAGVSTSAPTAGVSTSAAAAPPSATSPGSASAAVAAQPSSTAAVDSLPAAAAGATSLGAGATAGAALGGLAVAAALVAALRATSARQPSALTQRERPPTGRGSGQGGMGSDKLGTVGLAAGGARIEVASEELGARMSNPLRVGLPRTSVKMRE